MLDPDSLKGNGGEAMRAQLALGPGSSKPNSDSNSPVKGGSVPNNPDPDISTVGAVADKEEFPSGVGGGLRSSVRGQTMTWQTPCAWLAIKPRCGAGRGGDSIRLTALIPRGPCSN